MAGSGDGGGDPCISAYSKSEIAFLSSSSVFAALVAVSHSARFVAFHSSFCAEYLVLDSSRMTRSRSPSVGEAAGHVSVSSSPPAALQPRIHSLRLPVLAQKEADSTSN